MRILFLFSRTCWRSCVYFMEHKVAILLLSFLAGIAYCIVKQDMYDLSQYHTPRKKSFKLVEQLQERMDTTILDPATWDGASTDFPDISDMDRCSQERRQAILRDTCSRYNLTRNNLKRKDYWRLLVDKEKRIIYCSIPKAGCTSMRSLMGASPGSRRKRSTGKKVARPKITYLSNERYHKNVDYILETHSKLLLVRHPFSRLYSAYCDKIADGQLTHPEYYFEIAEKYFPGSVVSKKLELTFSQFATLVAYEYKTGAFVNRHWMTQYELSRPCNIMYDYIAKLETMAYDAGDILSVMQSKTGISKLNSHSKESADSTHIVAFRDIPNDVIHQLLIIYQADFRLFGYTWSQKFGASCTDMIRGEITGSIRDDCCHCVGCTYT